MITNKNSEDIMANAKFEVPKLSRLKFDADEISKLTLLEREHQISKFLNHYGYAYGQKELKKHIAKWMQSTGDWDAKDPARVIAGPDGWFPGTLGRLGKAWSDGWVFNSREVEYMQYQIREYLDKCGNSAPVAESVKKTGMPELTIQDRIKLKINEHIGHFEEQQDLLATKSKVDPEAFAYLKKENVSQNMLTSIAQPFIERMIEWQEAKAGTCEDLKEGYSHWQAKDYKKYFAFVEAILADIEAYAKTKKAVKVNRVKKAPNKQKIVSKVKYAKDNTQYKIASVDPLQIIGATELYVFNVKTRKLGKYVADEHMATLNVKGTTITGFDAQTSTQKTLRKPERQLPDFMGSSKTAKRKFLQGIKSVEIPLSGRLNSDTILLHVQ
jgi:hypothetical protein